MHRDLKPGNVLLSRNKTAKLADVGLLDLQVTRRPKNGSKRFRDTKTYYMSQDQAFIDPKYQQTNDFQPYSDVYSLGVIIMVTVTGRTAREVRFEDVDDAIAEGLEATLQLVDPLIEPPPANLVQRLLKLGLKCQERNHHRQRPALSEATAMPGQKGKDIITTLKEILEELDQ